MLQVEEVVASLPGTRLQSGDLPEARPPLAPPSCGYHCMRKIKLKTSCDVGQVCHLGQTGVYELELDYKPLRNVTGAMMVWLFQNLHKDMRLARDNSTWPMYLVFHSVDHMHHEAIPADNVTVGTKFTWCEAPLTGCSYNRSSATAPWVCPQQRAGFVRGGPQSAWANTMHTKVLMEVSRFDAGGIEFVRKESNPFFAGAGGSGDTSRTVVTTRHTWSDSPEGLRLTTQQWLGLMKANSTTEFDRDTIIAPVVNMIAKEKYLEGAANVPAGNITAAAWMAALHYLQEYGSLPHWLPHAYKANAALAPSQPTRSDGLLAISIKG